jgi:hypothetical protein
VFFLYSCHCMCCNHFWHSLVLHSFIMTIQSLSQGFIHFTIDFVWY